MIMDKTAEMATMQYLWKIVHANVLNIGGHFPDQDRAGADCHRRSLWLCGEQSNTDIPKSQSEPKAPWLNPSHEQSSAVPVEPIAKYEFAACLGDIQVRCIHQ